MTAVIGQIIQGFKEFLSKLEDMARYVVSELEKFGIAAAQKIQVLMSAAFKEIKDKISRLIKATTTKIESLQKRRPQTSIKSNTSRIRNALKSAGREAENVASRFKDSTVSLLKEVKEILTRLSDGLSKGVSVSSRYTKEAVLSIFNAMKNIGEGAIKEVKNFGESFRKDLEVVGNFVHKHELQIAEAAVISVLSPELLMGVLGAAGIVVLSHNTFL